jgi:hypothetical protein
VTADEVPALLERLMARVHEARSSLKEELDSAFEVDLVQTLDVLGRMIEATDRAKRLQETIEPLRSAADMAREIKRLLEQVVGLSTTLLPMIEELGRRVTSADFNQHLEVIRAEAEDVSLQFQPPALAAGVLQALEQLRHYSAPLNADATACEHQPPASPTVDTIAVPVTDKPVDLIVAAELDLAAKAEAATYSCGGVESRFEAFVWDEVKQGALTPVALLEHQGVLKSLVDADREASFAQWKAESARKDDPGQWDRILRTRETLHLVKNHLAAQRVKMEWIEVKPDPALAPFTWFLAGQRPDGQWMGFGPRNRSSILVRQEPGETRDATCVQCKGEFRWDPALLRVDMTRPEGHATYHLDCAAVELPAEVRDTIAGIQGYAARSSELLRMVMPHMFTIPSLVSLQAWIQRSLATGRTGRVVTYPPDLQDALCVSSAAVLGQAGWPVRDKEYGYAWVDPVCELAPDRPTLLASLINWASGFWRTWIESVRLGVVDPSGKILPDGTQVGEGQEAVNALEAYLAERVTGLTSIRTGGWDDFQVVTFGRVPGQGWMGVKNAQRHPRRDSERKLTLVTLRQEVPEELLVPEDPGKIEREKALQTLTGLVSGVQSGLFGSEASDRLKVVQWSDSAPFQFVSLLMQERFLTILEPGQYANTIKMFARIMDGGMEGIEANLSALGECFGALRSHCKDLRILDLRNFSYDTYGEWDDRLFIVTAQDPEGAWWAVGPDLPRCSGRVSYGEKVAHEPMEVSPPAWLAPLVQQRLCVMYGQEVMFSGSRASSGSVIGEGDLVAVPGPTREDAVLGYLKAVDFLVEYSAPNLATKESPEMRELARFFGSQCTQNRLYLLGSFAIYSHFWMGALDNGNWVGITAPVAWT